MPPSPPTGWLQPGLPQTAVVRGISFGTPGLFGLRIAECILGSTPDRTLNTIPCSDRMRSLRETGDWQGPLYALLFLWYLMPWLLDAEGARIYGLPIILTGPCRPSFLLATSCALARDSDGFGRRSLAHAHCSVPMPLDAHRAAALIAPLCLHPQKFPLPPRAAPKKVF